MIDMDVSAAASRQGLSGNPGIVPPWLQDDMYVLPVPGPGPSPVAAVAGLAALSRAVLDALEGARTS